MGNSNEASKPTKEYAEEEPIHIPDDSIDSDFNAMAEAQFPEGYVPSERPRKDDDTR